MTDRRSFIRRWAEICVGVGMLGEALSFEWEPEPRYKPFEIAGIIYEPGAESLNLYLKREATVPILFEGEPVGVGKLTAGDRGHLVMKGEVSPSMASRLFSFQGTVSMRHD